jgi:hypothetical protein
LKKIVEKPFQDFQNEQKKIVPDYQKIFTNQAFLAYLTAILKTLKNCFKKLFRDF